MRILDPNAQPRELILTEDALWLLARLLDSCGARDELFELSGDPAGTVLSASACRAWGDALRKELPNVRIVRFPDELRPGGRGHMLVAGSAAPSASVRADALYTEWLAEAAEFFTNCDGATLSDVLIERPEFSSWAQDLAAIGEHGHGAQREERQSGEYLPRLPSDSQVRRSRDEVRDLMTRAMQLYLLGGPPVSCEPGGYWEPGDAHGVILSYLDDLELLDPEAYRAFLSRCRLDNVNGLRALLRLVGSMAVITALSWVLDDPYDEIFATDDEYV